MRIQLLKTLLVICALAAGLLLIERPSSLAAAEPQAAQAPPSSAAPTKKDYSKFTHQSHAGNVKVPGTNQTRELKCDTCHERAARRGSIVETPDRNDRLQVDFPPHRTCIECHVVQFTGRPPETCSICHQGELNARPPQREFPARYDFNVYFDTKQHETHDTYSFPDGKKLDCAFCHQPTERKAARLIGSHPECYACHTPSSGDVKAEQKAGCMVCHTQMVTERPAPHNYTSVAYGAKFTHQTHIEYARGNCQACHTISGGYNQPAPQPATIRIRQHLGPRERSGKGCFSCHDGGVHDGRRVFSGEDANFCAKCHSGDNFKIPPARG